MNERILKFITYLGISVAEFERICDLSNGSVAKMGDNTRITTLDKISKKYPLVNIDWLRTGKGEMLKYNNQNIGDISNSKVSGVNVSGYDIQINPDAYETLLKVVETFQESTKQFQNQINRLITLLEKKYGE